MCDWWCPMTDQLGRRITDEIVRCKEKQRQAVWRFIGSLFTPTQSPHELSLGGVRVSVELLASLVEEAVSDD